MAKTVIIAVDDPNILYLLQRYAEESGLQTACVSQGKDVLALLAQSTNPALIILDAAPGMAHCQDITGRKAWRRVKLEAANRHIPVVVYSCLDEASEEISEEWHEDVADCLPKSVMYDDFVAALERAGVYLEPAFP